MTSPDFNAAARQWRDIIAARKGRYVLRHAGKRFLLSVVAARMREMIKEGASLDVRNHIGQTALMRAAGRGYDRVVKVLIDGGAEVDARDPKGRTALMLAAGNKNGQDAVRALLPYADLTARDNRGRTAAEYAESSGAWFAGKDINKAIDQKLDGLAHRGVDQPRETPPVPVMKKKPFNPGGKP